MLLSAEHAAAGRVRVYRRASVVDGTGDERFTADVAVEGTRIVGIRRGDDADFELPDGSLEVDATGLVLAPGFIDMHAHSDLAVLRGAEHTAKIAQGVTCEVIGQDGLGYAPLDERSAAAIPAQIAGWNGPAEVRWRTTAEFLEAIDAATAANVAVLVPQGNLRMMVIGHEDRAAERHELARMAELLGDALDAGAFGMSSGLTYTPGMYASTAELEALCRVVAERGGYWAPHTRSYGAAALDAYREVLDIGRRTGCPIHLTHATMNFAPNRGRAAELLAIVDAAVADGVDVTLDTYPYLPGATTLAALLPSRLAAGGDLVGTIAALDADGREQVRLELEEIGCDGFHGERADWSAIEVSGVAHPALAGLVGRRIDEIARSEGRRPVDVVLDTVVQDAGATGILMHIGDEQNVREIMRHPRHSGGSDGILIGDKPHPRGYGTFPHYLGHYVRELEILTLEQAVQHLSATPARRLGLDRGDAPRGIIREGATADLVLFDPLTVGAGATFETPRAEARGIVDVLVGGVAVIESGRPTGRTPGAALRMPPPAHRTAVPRLDAEIDAAAEPFVLRPGTVVEASDAFAGVAERLRDALRIQEPEDAAAGTIALVRDPQQKQSESFRIDVSAERIEVHAAEAVGAFRGVMALRQLLPPESANGARLPAGHWRGAPAFGWRGAMLDVARHFRPAADIRRLIDVLAAHQLNVLHLHLTDDQGWRFEVPGYPALTEVGARRDATQRGHGPLATVEPGRHEGHYTTAELRELVRYAAERFITLVPEVELPGHVQAALAAYPALGNTDASDPVDGPWERFGVNERTLAPTEESLAFGRTAIDALCDVFDSPWIGIGGDEVPVTEWQRSPAAQERMRALGLNSARDIQPWFTAHLVAHVRSRGRTALAWDEVLEGDVPDGVEILAWRAPVALQEALDRGIPVIACPDLEVYLDYRQSESTDEPVPVGPPLTIEHAYTLHIDERALGGQANTWTEHLPSRDRVDFAMFPRLSAIAERLWLGGEPDEYAGFARRLPVQLRRLAAMGVRYRPLDGPSPEQRRPGVPGKPMSVQDRQRIVAELVAGLGAHGGAESAHR
ncbi:family 20 glycosylhydrolase [Microbacterium sp. M28]|uniref:family 20 glycosylhydrolase n=1 Tax=Microbacterium sp. M28 TaxID=2962064 RepID=UPI0021F49DEA|nr:family 20 glycosylhydrolase [Microbacterium sp. M28]UYO96265.1 family 20 glycosylhydrolase [Microbacterium sp. M28]